MDLIGDKVTKPDWEETMKKWSRPVIQELRVGMEINLYVCAEL